MSAYRPTYARSLTRALRTLLPAVRPLSTRTDLSDNGMILSYTVTMPAPAARNIGAGDASGQVRLERYLSRQVGRDLCVTNVQLYRRETGNTVRITVRTAEMARAMEI